MTFTTIKCFFPFYSYISVFLKDSLAPEFHEGFMKFPLISYFLTFASETRPG